MPRTRRRRDGPFGVSQEGPSAGGSSESVVGSGVWCMGIFRAPGGTWSLFLTVVTERRGFLHSGGTWAWTAGGRPDCFPTVSEQVSSSASRRGAAPGPGAAGSPDRKPPEMESCRSGEQRGGPWACCLGLWGPRAGVRVWGVGTVPLCSCWDPMSEPKSHGRKQEGPLQAAHAPQVTTPQPPAAVGTEADPSRTGPPRTAPTPTDPCALVVSSQGRSRRPPLEVPPGGTPISPLCARRTGTRWQDDACALFPWQEAAQPTACPGDASRPRAPGPLGPHLSVILNQSPASPTAGWGPLAPRPHILGP